MTQAAVVPIKRGEDNPHKIVNQYRKARKIAEVLITHYASHADVVNASGAMITMAATLAETSEPSETTWALVVELVKEAKP